MTTPSAPAAPVPDPPHRYATSQRSRTLVHPTLPQRDGLHEDDDHGRPSGTDAGGGEGDGSAGFNFVVCADTQIGMTSLNREWETELAYSREAIAAINALSPRPLFCCVCGDLVDMVASYYAAEHGAAECDRVQDLQNADWKATWTDLHPAIALVCVCGNHDVGNRPTRATVQRFVGAFGDDYLAFWARRAYNLVLNTALFWDPTDAEDLYREQLAWLEGRLVYANEHRASHIFVFGHHPWFLYDDRETVEDLAGISPRPKEWDGEGKGFDDSYFHVPIQHRRRVMELFRKHNVTACFSGHFHQNLVSTASFGMPMIVTSSLSLVFRSSGIPDEFDEPKDVRGLRIVQVLGDGKFEHKFVTLP